MRVIDTGSKVLLTLQYPKGLRGLPIASSSNVELLHFFRIIVLQEWLQRVKSSTDPSEKLINNLEYRRIESALNALLPERNPLWESKHGS